MSPPRNDCHRKVVQSSVLRPNCGGPPLESNTHELCGKWDKVLNFVPWFSHLQNYNNNNSYLVGLEKLLHVKHLEQSFGNNRITGSQTILINNCCGLTVSLCKTKC